MKIDLSRLMEMRKKLGLTRKEFAETVGRGCIEHTVYRWELGITKKPLPVYQESLEKFFKKNAYLLDPKTE